MTFDANDAAADPTWIRRPLPAWDRFGEAAIWSPVAAGDDAA